MDKQKIDKSYNNKSIKRYFYNASSVWGSLVKAL